LIGNQERKAKAERISNSSSKLNSKFPPVPPGYIRGTLTKRPISRAVIDDSLVM
jgi:hypothetical protein